MIRTKISGLPLYLLLLLIASGGCMRDNTDGCEETVSFRLAVRGYDNAGQALGPADITSVTLYTFDSDLYLIGIMEAQTGDEVIIEGLADEDIQVVGWGNLGDNSIVRDGDHRGEFTVGLRADTRTTAYALPPDDLFHGQVTLSRERDEAVSELPLYRRTGSLSVTIKGLRSYAGYDDDNYTAVVGETWSAIGFDGTLQGEKTNYRAEGGFDGGDTWRAAPFNLLPEPDGVAIHIYHGQDEVIRLAEDRSGKPFAIHEGLQTNVLIDLTVSVNVNTTWTDWGSEVIWKEY